MQREEAEIIRTSSVCIYATCRTSTRRGGMNCVELDKVCKYLLRIESCMEAMKSNLSKKILHREAQL